MHNNCSMSEKEEKKQSTSLAHMVSLPSPLPLPPPLLFFLSHGSTPSPTPLPSKALHSGSDALAGAFPLKKKVTHLNTTKVCHIWMGHDCGKPRHNIWAGDWPAVTPPPFLITRGPCPRTEKARGEGGGSNGVSPPPTLTLASLITKNWRRSTDLLDATWTVSISSFSSCIVKSNKSKK